MKKVTVSRRAHFNAAHRLHNPAWTDEKNREVFGKCNRPNYHGHNYDLVVKVGGHIDLETGFVVDMKWLADLIDEVIVERFDHQNLNLDTVEFRNLNPTAENIAVVVWDLLRPHISMDKTLKVEIYETERNFVEYGGE
jgi:6-pyruvoyltetrahydropterin/6-carboxytetrahydropterin synthase